MIRSRQILVHCTVCTEVYNTVGLQFTCGMEVGVNGFYLYYKLYMFNTLTDVPVLSEIFVTEGL